jgi:EmrB/QacA subfamily drug resistance transporter
LAIAIKAPCDEAGVLVRREAAPCAPDVGRWVLAAAILGSSMAFIDGTVVNLALPVLQADLEATGVQVQWVVQAEALFLAALMLAGGSLGDRLGRKRVFLAGVALFAAASAAAGLAPGVGPLIVAQAVKGVGGALLVPGSLAMISANFSQAQRGRAIGTWSGATAVTMALGPVLGGWLVESLSWRAVFFLSIPLAAAALAITRRGVPESRDDEAGQGPLDWGGTLLTVLGVGGLVYGLTESSRLGLGHPYVLGALGLGVLSLLAFVWLESRLAAPMLPPRLFHDPTFSGANLLTLLLYGALYGVLFFFPFNLIQVQGYSPSAAGLALLPFIVIMSALSRWSGGLVERYGARRPLIAGPIIVAAGFALFAAPGVGGSYWTTFFPAVGVLGLGMALTVAPLTTAVMNSVPTHQAGIASGANNAVSRVAGLLGIAVSGMLIFTAFNSALTGRLAPLELPAETRQAIDAERADLAAAEAPPDVEPETRAAIQRAIKEAYLAGFRAVMLAAAGLALAGALIAWWMIERPHT